MSNSIYKEQLQAVVKLEKSLNLPKNFFRSLRNDDDWSFIIKMHALIESSLSRLIEAKFNNFSLKDYFLTIGFSGGRHSKIKLLQQLGEIDPEECKFIEGLSFIRNRLVHNITHIKFNLETYVAQLSAKSKLNFATQTCSFFTDFYLSRKTERQAKIADILVKPKWYLWLCALHVIACASLRIDAIFYESDIEKAQKKIYALEAQRAKELLRLLAKDLDANAGLE